MSRFQVITNSSAVQENKSRDFLLEEFKFYYPYVRVFRADVYSSFDGNSNRSRHFIYIIESSGVGKIAIYENGTVNHVSFSIGDCIKIEPGTAYDIIGKAHVLIVATEV